MSDLDTSYPPIVFIVEDEPIQRIAAVDRVEDAGFLAVEATNAPDALLILEILPDVEIVISDLDMPHGIDGVELASAIRERWPAIQIILTSGRSDGRNIKRPFEAVFFAEPYDESRVVAQLYRMSAEERAKSSKVHPRGIGVEASRMQKRRTKIERLSSCSTIAASQPDTTGIVNAGFFRP